MSKYGQLAKNTILIGVGSFSSKLLTFLCVPLYTALLTTEQYGLADIITTTSILVFQILTLSISEGLMRFCLEEDSDKSHIQHEHPYYIRGLRNPCSSRSAC